MTKQEHIDALFTAWGPLDKGRTKQMAEVALNMAYNQLIFDCESKRIPYNLSTKKFNEVDVEQDADTDIYYAEYPAEVVSVGAYKVVNTVKGTGYRFYPTTERELRVVEGLSCVDITSKIGYVPKRDRVEFYQIEDSDGASVLSHVSLELAIQFREFADSDVVLSPSGRDYEMTQLALDYLMKEKIIDLRND